VPVLQFVEKGLDLGVIVGECLTDRCRYPGVGQQIGETLACQRQMVVTRPRGLFRVWLVR
jgi:hypothetical protein